MTTNDDHRRGLGSSPRSRTNRRRPIASPLGAALGVLLLLLLATPPTAEAGVPRDGVKWIKARHTVQERAKCKCLWWMPGGSTFWSHTVQEEIFLLPWRDRVGR